MTEDINLTDRAKILIIDDDANLRKSLSDILKMKGYETMSAANGAAGIAALTDSFINIVIIDLGLPDMSGIEVLDKIKGASPLTEAIILTGNATLDSAIEATNRGAFSFLLKPYDIDQLLVHMERAISRQQTGQRTAKQNAELQKMNSELKALHDVSLSLNRTLDILEIFPELLSMITNIGIFSVERKGCIFLTDGEGIRMVSSIGLSQELVERCSRVKSGECLCGLAAGSGEIIISNNSTLDDRHTIISDDMKRHGHIIVPLKTVDKIVGVLCLYVASELQVDSRLLQLLSTLGNQIGIAIGNAKLYEETKSFSLHDPLTGLGNRRLLQIYLDKGIASAKRYEDRFSVLMLDIDHFKRYNDIHGHAGGDTLLVNLANILISEVRCADWVFRYGGEEFLVMLPETGIARAAEAAERLRNAVEERTGVTVSIGVAEYGGLTESTDDLIKRADAALYQAKDGGRNRVEVSVR